MNNYEKVLWIERIQEYKSSGLTAIKWCEEKNIPVHKLRYQTFKLNKEAKQCSEKVKWTSIVPEKPITNKEISNPLKVTIGQSTIEVGTGFDPDTF